MESEYGDSESRPDDAAQDHLDALRRAELLTHTRYPKLGPWYPPSFGLLAAVFVAGYAAPLWLGLLIWIATAAIAGFGLGWYVRRRGVMPSMRRAPGAIRREAAIFFTGYLLAIFVICVFLMTVAWWAASIAAFVLMAALVGWYEARFHATARQLEAEAGITTPAQGVQ